ncbi:hypothetical protein TRIUR3_29695 [Triticum urartu]|uniref:Uncharacterized protein n=1 Tax=Triticum urartu TaxID=4572 RepID=M7YLJ5_TRIUA|nr:hypothetical protein TRIUR3_29695 [Triticum urartu]
MAAPSGLTATVTSPPAALRTLAPPGLFLRPISRCSRPHSLKAKAAAKDQDEKKPEATKKKAYSLVCTACEGNVQGCMKLEITCSCTSILLKFIQEQLNQLKNLQVPFFLRDCYSDLLGHLEHQESLHLHRA